MSRRRFAVAAAVALVAVAAAAQMPTFQHVVIDAANPSDPHCKTLGDIDGDGLLDALAASSSGDGLYWYEYPSWSKHPIRASGSWTTDMQTADIDADGDLDVVIPNSSGLQWYENPRPGGDPRTAAWSEHLIGASGGNNHDVEVGDVDGDGDLDVVTRRKNGNGTYFWRQTTPTTWTRITVSSLHGEGIALGDVDGDGDLDVAQNGSWAEQVDPLTWSEHTIDASWPDDSGVLVIDVDGNGANDVVLAPSESSSGRFSWYSAADPKAGPWSEHSIDSSVSYLHTFKSADMNRDGLPDMVTAEMHQSSDPDEVSVYYNPHPGSVWTQQVVATTGSHNVRVGDMGGDGDIDIFGANWNDSAPNSAVIEMWENQSAPLPLDQWQRHIVETSLPWNAVLVDAGDVDGDGRTDIVTGGWWYPNPGTLSGAWTRTTIGAPLHNMAALHDFDGDGDLDVLGTDGQQNGEDFSWARNDGAGAFTNFGITSPALGGDFLQGVAVDQVTPGGNVEVVLSWHNGASGTSMFEVPVDPTTAAWPLSTISATTNMEAVPTGDLDGDGDIDVHLGDNWLRQDPGGVFTTRPGVTITGGGVPDRVVLADVDGDSDLDVVIGVEFADNLLWGENTPGGWIEHAIAADVDYFSVGVADFDKDGDRDVAGGAHMGNGEVYLYENDGTGGGWTRHTVDPGDSNQIDHHDGTLPVDLDGDGDLDIVSIGWSKRSLVIYENLAIDGGGGGGDTTPPEIGSVFAVGDPNRVTVDFSEPVEVSTAESVGNYAISGGVVVTAATLAANARAVTLTTSALSAGVVYTLTVDAVEDLAGNPIAPASQETFEFVPGGPAAGLVAHWPLDEGDGSVAVDVAGGGHHGALVNGAAWLTGPAVGFDGVDDYIDAGPLDVASSALTLALWGWSDNLANCSSNDCRLLSKATGTAEGDHIFMLSTIESGGATRLRFRLRTGGVTTTLIASSGDLAEGQWFHAAAVYDGGEMRLYLDGALAGATGKSGAVAQNPAVDLWIGGNPDGAGSKPWAGRLDDVRIYDRALTPAELAALPPPSVNAIFSDGFESGDLAAWGRSPGGVLAVTSGAAASGTSGLEIAVGSSCAAPEESTVEPPPAVIAGVFTACRLLRVRDVTVSPAAELVAGESVTLDGVFGVDAAAELTLTLDPPLSPWAWVEDGSPAAVDGYVADFALRLDALALDPGDSVDHFVGTSATGEVVLRVILERGGSPAVNRLRLWAAVDGGGGVETAAGGEIELGTGWKSLRVEWHSGAGDGRLEVSIDGSPATALTGLANGSYDLDRVRWGAVDGVLGGGGPAGKIEVDAFASWVP